MSVEIAKTRPGRGNINMRMDTKKLTIEPLSKQSKDRIEKMRAAHARGEGTARITAEGFSRADLAATLQRTA